VCVPPETYQEEALQVLKTSFAQASVGTMQRSDTRRIGFFAD